MHSSIGPPWDSRTRVGEIKKQDITPVTLSDWATPIVPAEKCDSSVKVCKLTVNWVSKTEVYPIPKIKEMFASLTGGKNFSKLDLSHAYQREESQKYVTVNTHKGLFQYKRLPFSVASAPALFQLTWNLCYRACPRYIDDIVVTGKDDEEHLHKQFVQPESTRTEAICSMQGWTEHPGWVLTLGRVVVPPQVREEVMLKLHEAYPGIAWRKSSLSVRLVAMYGCRPWTEICQYSRKNPAPALLQPGRSDHGLATMWVCLWDKCSCFWWTLIPSGWMFTWSLQQPHNSQLKKWGSWLPHWGCCQRCWCWLQITVWFSPAVSSPILLSVTASNM